MSESKKTLLPSAEVHGPAESGEICPFLSRFRGPSILCLQDSRLDDGVSPPGVIVHHQGSPRGEISLYGSSLPRQGGND